MPDPAVLAFVLATLPAPPARVLEVGAGDGRLAAALRDRGHDVVAIDPAGAPPGVRQVALLELDEPPASFDAAVAVVSLHHVEPLAPSCRRLAELVRPGGPLAIDEMDVERLDERAARWWLDQQARLGTQHGHAERPADAVAELRHHIHPVARLREALSPWFHAGEPVRGPYLHRWHLPPGLRAAEERLIAAGALPATGARLVAVRRADGDPRAIR
jgi:SAM-dependent methyltransferase